MTEIRLLDYSSARPTYAAIKSSGAVGVLRYLTRSTGPKRLTATEATALRKAGLQIGVVFEDAAQRASQGIVAGRSDALLAASQAKTVGVPTTCPIFFAVDFDTTPAAVRAYFEGIAAARIAHPIGVYGGIKVVEGILAAGLASFGWQTAAWSAGKVSVKAHLYQRSSPTHRVPGTDENVLLKHLPLWGAPSPVTTPTRPVAKKTTVTPVTKPAPKPVAKQAPAPVKKAPPKPYRYKGTLKLGSIGGDVCHLQRRLGMHVTGFYGTRTRARVRAFQRQHGLRPDGVAGVETQKVAG